MKKSIEPKIFKSYPEILPIFVVLFISGLLLSECFTNDLCIAWLGISLAFFVLSFFTQTPKSKTITLFVAALSASMFYGAIRQNEKYNFSNILTLDNTQGVLEGRYTGQSSIQNKNKIIYTFKEVSYTTNEQRVVIPAKVNCQCVLNRQRLYPEQYYSLTGKIRIISFDKAPIFEVASLTYSSSISAPQNLSILTTAKKIQTSIRTGINKALNEEQSAIVNGFILGDTSKILDKSIFTETGISHVLAISGQHIMILIFLMASIMHWFKIPPISRSVMISIILAFYAMVTVGSPSIWRALIMYISVATIMHLESSSSPIRPISIAALLMLLYDPSYLKNAAFILSFTAVLSIIFLRQPIEYILSLLHLPKLLNRYLAVTFAANLGTMPMVAYIFGTLSLSSLFVNPLILWSFTIILPISFAIAFLSIFSISTLYLSSGLAVLLDSLISFLEYVKSIPGLYFYVGNIKPITVLGIYAIMLYLTSVFNKWQIKHLKEAYSKSELDKIPVTQLPKEKTIEIRIDSKSKATPTLIGKETLVPKKEILPPNKPAKPSNPLRNNEIIEAIDEILCGLKRIKIRNHEKSKEIIPVNSLVIDSQNLYYRLFEMDKDLFNKEPERLLQAHIFMLSLIGFELLNRLNSYLTKPIPKEIIEIEQKTNDKFLAIAIIADSIMISNIPNEVTEEQIQVVLNQGKLIFIRAQKLLQQILNDKNFEDSIKQHLTLREELVKWCIKFVQTDNIIKLRKRKNLR